MVETSNAVFFWQADLIRVSMGCMAAVHYFTCVKLITPQDMLGCNEQPISDNVKALKARNKCLGGYVLAISRRLTCEVFSQVTN